MQTILHPAVQHASPLYPRVGMAARQQQTVEQSALNPYRYAGTPDLGTAQRYCKRLAQSRKEDFFVTTFCCPSDIRQHVFNIYAFARIADDLSDEVESSETALALLNWSRSE